VKLAKAKPGSLNYGSYGIASMAQLNIEALKAKMAIDLTHVPYKGAGPAVQAGGAGGGGGESPPAAPRRRLIPAGRPRPLAIGDKGRSLLLPDVPTLTQAGGDDDTLVPTYFAFALPARTPALAVSRLHGAMRLAVKSPDTAERLRTAGLEPTGGTGTELAALVARDIPRFRGIIQNIGIQPE